MLIGRVCEGDHGAFGALYVQLGARLWRRPGGADPSCAEEVTQEVFLEIWRPGTALRRRLRVGPGMGGNDQGGGGL